MPEKKPMPNMREVSAACGYSQATVSLALRGDPSIPEKTRTKILEAAEKLGYKVSPLVSALMSLQRQRKPTASLKTVIAYITSHPASDPWRKHPYFVSMFKGAEERAAEVGCHLEEFNLRADKMSPARVKDILVARGIRGAIIAPLPFGQTSLDLDLGGLAAVGLGMSVASPIIERIASDHFQGAQLAVEQCLALGYRRIGFLISQETSRRLNHRWLAGYRFALEQNQLEHRLPALITEKQAELPSETARWLDEQKPDVVLLGNAERAIQEKVPLDVGLASMGVEKVEGGLSGIYQNYRLLGRVTTEHVLAKLYSNNFAPLEECHLHLIAGSWFQGATTPGAGKLRPHASDLKSV